MKGGSMSAAVSNIVGFDHITVTAPIGQHDVVRWFYGDLLGLEEIVRPRVLEDSGPVWFRLNCGQQLHVSFEASVHNLSTARHIGLRVRSAEDVLATLRANGFEARVESNDGQGRTVCFCQDPFGNRIEFVEQAVLATA